MKHKILTLLILISFSGLAQSRLTTVSGTTSSSNTDLSFSIGEPLFVIEESDELFSGINQSAEVHTTNVIFPNYSFIKKLTYQNPVNSTLNVVLELDDNPKPIEYQIFDLSGKLHINGTLDEGLNSIEVHQLTKSEYILSIITNSQNIKSLKFTKQ